MIELVAKKGWVCFPTFNVIQDGLQIGVIQHHLAANGLTRQRDDGKRVIWKGDGTKAGEHLGLASNETEAIERIIAEHGNLTP